MSSMSMAVKVTALVLAACSVLSVANTDRNAKEVEEAERSLTQELEARGAAHERIVEFEEALAGTYAALPKTPEGRLEHQTARYILHRLFVQRHGWYIKGLEPGGDVWSSDSKNQSARDWLPSFLLDDLESRLEGDGIDLNDLSALAAALEDLARKEVVSTMTDVYASLGFPATGDLTYSQVQEAIDTYMVFFLGDGKWKLEAGMVSDFAEKHDYWNATHLWIRGLEKSHVTSSDGSHIEASGFKKVVKIAQDLGAEYSSYNSFECSRLKTALLSAWSKGNSTGRVSLADFYKLGLDSEWALTEKVDYLRSIGAIDDSNPGSLMVIVPNYLTARPNCLQSTSLYSVCCRNECEDLMGQLERNLSSPTAAPERIASFVSGLASATVAAPRELPMEMLERLDDMAMLHGGEVHIHGRLFAQWMHHAFPGECPFPHEAGSTDPITPDEWMDSDVEATEQERREHMASAGVLTEEGADIVLPWSQTEELLGAKHINLTDAATSLAFELSGASKARLHDFRSALQPYYASLPKDDDGYLEHQTARYVLHRLFVKRHSWYVKGLEPNGDVWHSSADEDVSQASLRDWVPAYLIDLLQERLGRRGLDLNDLAALGAAIEDLIHKEAEGSLDEVYTSMEIERVADRAEVHRAISAYMVVYLGNGAWSLQSAMTDEFAQKHSYWNATEAWLTGIEASHLGDAGDSVDFEMAAAITKDIGARYGAYNDEECQKLKVALMNTWGRGRDTGRVRLVDFYKLGLDSEWSLTEKASYLRSIGALDDSNASAPMVIIPNYLSAQPNCVQSTSLYAICCRNECEDLMSEIELSLAAPAASPQRIFDLVASLRSSSMDAPRELPQILMERLEGIAAVHGGEVNLHGRLFAQWMHHGFPSECPYPHEAGASDPVSPDEWMGEDIEASEEERKHHVESDMCGPDQAAAEWAVELPWSLTEELLSSTAMRKVQMARSAETRWSPTALGAGLLLLAVLVFALAIQAVPQQERQKCLAFANFNSRPLLIAMILLVAFATNIINRFLVVLLVGFGLSLRRFSPSCGETIKAFEKEKACV